MIGAMGETKPNHETTIWRAVRWGDALAAELNRTPDRRGLQAIIEAVDVATGTRRFRGVRGSYAHLIRLDGPPTEPAACTRAWLTLTALGCDPAEWGLTEHDDDLGPFMNRELLGRALRTALWGPGKEPPPPASKAL